MPKFVQVYLGQKQSSPLKATQMPVVLAATCGLAGVWGLCCHLGSVLQSHTESWSLLGQGCSQRPWLGPWLYSSQSLSWSVALVTTEGYVDARGLVSLMRQCWCLRGMLPPGPYRSAWPVLSPGAMVTFRSELLSRTLSGFVVPLPMGSVLMFRARVTTGSHRNHAC